VLLHQRQRGLGLLVVADDEGIARGDAGLGQRLANIVERRQLVVANACGLGEGTPSQRSSRL